MRLAATVVVLGACAITRAQLSNIPQCSLKCLTSALGADGCSELTDFACHCQKTGLVEQVVPCVKQDCDVTDQQAVSKVVVSLCSGAGQPISIPPVDSAPASTAAPTTSSSFNSTTASGIERGPQTRLAASMTSTTGSTASSTVNTASPSSIPLSNRSSGIQSGAARVAGVSILLASMMFLV
ncbi:CFEM-domain-containing protein [Aspergillus steynii IBT 23096]|uniref:CFEM-domain-containing protein n=1 Tax=Aspergillus steynii IBT 23096 TaxID=1392250 RepID=A0A2I2GA47_9EURO|nr:CFEM-domain-containing protein [Aspergillus steynii IBT 23096]PLB49752.1 CFEM-domain-containing protein [Aspergillus steynii IBT 23096]